MSRGKREGEIITSWCDELGHHSREGSDRGLGLRPAAQRLELPILCKEPRAPPVSPGALQQNRNIEQGHGQGTRIDRTIFRMLRCPKPGAKSSQTTGRNRLRTPNLELWLRRGTETCFRSIRNSERCVCVALVKGSGNKLTRRNTKSRAHAVDHIMNTNLRY